LNTTPGLAAQFADALQRAVQVRPGLGMDAHDIGPGGGEGLQVGIGRRDHQMHVDRHRDVRPQGLHHVRAEGDVGHEMAVHHVHVQPVGAGGLDGAAFLAETGEVRREDGRSDDRGGHALGLAGACPEGQGRSDFPHHPGGEEAVDAALEVVRQDAQPAFGADAAGRRAAFAGRNRDRA
jgi:hypothetical protein